MDSIARAGAKEITIMETRIANSLAGFAPMAVSEEQDLQCKGVDLMACETKNNCALWILNDIFLWGWLVSVSGQRGGRSKECSSCE